MTNRLNSETLPTVAVLDDFSKLTNYSLIDTFSCSPDTQASRDRHTPRQVFASRYVPVNPTPIRNAKYVAHSKINFHELSFTNSIVQSVDVVSLAQIVRIISTGTTLIEAKCKGNSEIDERSNHAKASGETGLISCVKQAFSASYPCPTLDRCQAGRSKLNTYLIA